jgi:pyridoxine 5-phosphate synthase
LRKKIKLGVNVDHIATLRQARGEGQPVVLDAVKEVIAAGADSIVAHLREDRRHIQDKDIFDIRRAVKHFDMEMAATPEMLNIALKVKPDIVTLVPEKRQELTT